MQKQFHADAGFGFTFFFTKEIFHYKSSKTRHHLILQKLQDHILRGIDNQKNSQNQVESNQLIEFFMQHVN